MWVTSTSGSARIASRKKTEKSSYPPSSTTSNPLVWILVTVQVSPTSRTRRVAISTPMFVAAREREACDGAVLVDSDNRCTGTVGVSGNMLAKQAKYKRMVQRC